MRYWLNSPDRQHPEEFAARSGAVCAAYGSAIAMHELGTHLVSVDEKTGMQAIERAAPTLPMRPGQVERQEANYVRHGTLMLTANLEVATGKVICPTVALTRHEEDFAAHVAQTVASDPQAAWIIVLDQLNTHQSETLVRLVDELCGLGVELGVKGESGLLKDLKSRRAFLEDPSHRIRFLYTPRHASWLNQIEILVQHPGTPAAAPGQLPIHRRVAAACPGVHRVLQPDDGQAVPVDLSGPALERVTDVAERVDLNRLATIPGGKAGGARKSSSPTGDWTDRNASVAGHASAWSEQPRSGHASRARRRMPRSAPPHHPLLTRGHDISALMIYIQPLGQFAGRQLTLIDETAKMLAIFYNLPVKTLEAMSLDVVPAGERRKAFGSEQIRSGYVLEMLIKQRPAVIALTTSDLWPGPGWNFVFGEATLDQRVGVWSLHRFGDPQTEYDLALRRTLQTAVHETGHMFGILHCIKYECCMNGSNHMVESDAAPMAFCPECEQKIWWACKADPLKRYEALAEFTEARKLAKDAEMFRKCAAVLR